VVLKGSRSRAVSHEGALCYWKELLFFDSMFQGILPNHILTLLQYVTSVYKDLWFKVTINDLRINVSLL